MLLVCVPWASQTSTKVTHLILVLWNPKSHRMSSFRKNVGWNWNVCDCFLVCESCAHIHSSGFRWSTPAGGLLPHSNRFGWICRKSHADVAKSALPGLRWQCDPHGQHKDKTKEGLSVCKMLNKWGDHWSETPSAQFVTLTVMCLFMWKYVQAASWSTPCQLSPHLTRLPKLLQQ